MSEQLHIPVVGSGSIGTRHYNNLIALDVSSELLSYRAAGVPGVRSLLQRGVADGVVIATATDVRHELIALCADFNVPMYIEKPLAVSPAQVTALYDVCPVELQRRSVAGFMMRYHPLFRWLCAQDLEDTYRFNLTIGHDVSQWRSNWRFSESYAASPNGGGVLLDLCHELDMTHTLFPRLVIDGVHCLGHESFADVDFSADVVVHGAGGAFGSVCMDYLSPISTRIATFYGRKTVTQVDFNALCCRRSDGENPHQEVIEFERNTMFVEAMHDFLRLVRGQPATALCPRLDRVASSAAFIADAWRQRQFNGKLSHPVL